MTATDEFTSHTTCRMFKIKSAASCKSSNIIYLITCKRCSQQYVGETVQLQPLHRRIIGHHFNITHGKTEESLVVEHFNHIGHTFAEVTIVAINKIHSHNSCLRKIQESRWIRTLGTSYPSRMNFRVDSVWNLLDDHQFSPHWSVVPPTDNKARRYNKKTSCEQSINTWVDYKYNVYSINVWAHTAILKKAQRGWNI